MAGTGNLILKRGVNMPYDKTQDSGGTETTPVLLKGMPAAQIIGSVWGLTSSDNAILPGYALDNYPNRLWIGTDEYAKDNPTYGGGAEAFDDIGLSVEPYTGETAPTHPTINETRPIWMGAEIRAYTPLFEDTSNGSVGSTGPYVVLKADWDRPSDYVLATQKAISRMPLRYYSNATVDPAGPPTAYTPYIEFSGWNGSTDGALARSTQYLFPSTDAPTIGHVLKISSVTAGTVPGAQIVKLQWASAGSATGTMSNFVISADTGTDQTVDDAETIEFAGGTGIDTVASDTNTITFNLDLSELTTEGSPAVGDFLSGVDVSASNVTRNFTIGTALGVLGGDISVNTSTGSATVSATNVKAAATTDNTTVLALLDNANTTAQSVKYDADLTYDATSNTLSVTNLSATTITGTVSTATNANNINISSTNANNSDTTTYLTLVAADSTGNQALHIDSSRLTYNALTQNLIVGSSSLTQGKLSTKTIDTTEITRSNNTLYLWTAGGSGVVIGDSATPVSTDDSTKPVLSVDYRTQSGTNRSFVSINGGDLYLGRKAIPTSGPTYTPVNIIFDGTTLDATNRTTLTAAEPSAARTVTIPDATGTVVLKDGSNNIGAGIINNLVVGGNLTVSGTTTTVNTETVTIDDNIIVLNNNEASTPTQNAGIEVERGTSNNVSLLWSESSDKWSATRINSDVSTYPNTFYPMVIADSSSALHAAGTEGSAASGEVTFNGTISGTNLTTTSVTGKLTPGMYIFGSGITAGTSIVSQTSGTPEGAGVYVISASHTIGTAQAFTAESGRLGQQYIHTASIKYLDVKNLVMSGSWTLNAIITSNLDLKDGGLKLPYVNGIFHVSSGNDLAGLPEGHIAYDIQTNKALLNIGSLTTTTVDNPDVSSGTVTQIPIVTESQTQTLSNKTLTLPKINDTSSNHTYTFAVNELTADRTVTLPLLAVNDTFVFEAHSQTLTNKTIDNIKASAAGATTSLHSEVTTGSIAIGAGVTSGSITLGGATGFGGTINLANGANTTGTKTINIGTSGGSSGSTKVTIGSCSSGHTSSIVEIGCPSSTTKKVFIQNKELVFGTNGGTNQVTLAPVAITVSSPTHSFPDVASGNLVVASTTNFNTSGYLLTGGGTTTPSVYTDPENVVVGGVYFRNETTGSGATRYPIAFFASQLSTDNPSTFGALSPDNVKTTGYLKTHWSTAEDQGLYYAPGDTTTGTQPSVNGGTLYAGFFAGYLDCGEY